ncbi:ESPR-type extended signal peptide-containing protein [uncultured Megasphaera sp.]|uniref:ESPR-type extended signal peptide-containing protein n=1 Tax=uncultured Megasphaera sp. TaxID=165188 RepID=UPI00258928C7|nr:ESPR-type extended signal peptide-containing protein [uncultured Megasphaera sp.]
MNKIFKVIWSKARNCYIVVSELAKNHDTGHTSRIRGGLLAASLMLSLSCPMYGFAADMPNTYTTGGVTYTLSSSSGLTGIYYDEGSNKCATVTYQGNEYNPEKASVILTVDKSGAVDEKGNVVYGEGNTANGHGNVIYGKSNSADVGTQSDAGQAVVMGIGNAAKGKNTTIIGQYNTENAENDVVIGNQNKTKGNSVVMGKNNTVNSPNAVAIGSDIKVNGSSAGGIVIIGNNAMTDSQAGGWTENKNNQQVYHEGGIVLGENSYSNRKAGRTGYVPGSKTGYMPGFVDTNGSLKEYVNVSTNTKIPDLPKGWTAGIEPYWNAVWTATANPLSIGNADDDANEKGELHNGKLVTRQITGVAAGTALTDAVNVAQLEYAIAQFSQGGGGTGGSDIHFYSVNEKSDQRGNYDNKGATGTDALAAGVDAQATGNYSVAVGNGANAPADGAVAIGEGSIATRGKGNKEGTVSIDQTTGKTTITNYGNEKTAYLKPDNLSTDSTTWVSTAGAVSVGGTTEYKEKNDNGKFVTKTNLLTRQITNVAAGSDDTDAVNVAQLKRLNENLSGQHTIVTVGGNSVAKITNSTTGGNLDLTRTTATNGQETYDLSLDRHVTLGEQAENKGGSLTVNNVDAFKNYDEKGNRLDDSIIKEAVKIDGKTVSIVKRDGTDGENDQRQVVLGVGQDTGGYVTLYDSTGKKPTYIYNAISPGITYLKDKDSYSKPDEFGRLEYKISNDPPQFIATLDDGQKYAGDNYLAADIETTDGKTTVKKEEQNVITKKLNERLDIQGGAKDKLTQNNIGVNVVDGVLKVQLAKDIDLTNDGSVTMGNTTINNGGVTITTKDGNKTNTISLTDNGLNNGGKTITNVAEGTNGTDAVNVSQLKASKTTVTSENHSVMIETTNDSPDKHTNYDLKIATASLSQEKSGIGDSAVATGKVTVTNPKISIVEDGETKQIDNLNAYVTGQDVADAINNSGFKLTTSAGAGKVSGTTTELIHPGDTVTIDAGKNIDLTQDKDKITIALSDQVNLHQDGSLSLGGTNSGTASDGEDPIVIRHFDGNTLDLITGTNHGTPITSKEGKAGDYVTGLDNKDWSVDNPTYVSGRAATEDQLKAVTDAMNNATTAAGKHTAITVNDNKNPEEATPGNNAYGEYNSTNGNLMISAKKDDNGQMTYNIKLNENLNLSDNGSVKMGNTTINNNGITILYSAGDTSKNVSLTNAGLDNGGNKITNVAKGESDNDAVNMSQLNQFKTRYYSVNDQYNGHDVTLPDYLKSYSNKDNLGGKKYGSLAAGYVTYADGYASTVAGSFSDVTARSNAPYQGATAVSYGTFNRNESSEKAGTYSGVANSIVGQANMTSDSNASLIYGAGNVITNSYRDIDDSKLGDIVSSQGNPQKLGEALQAAVPQSGGQVMAFGGGNTVDTAYMTQVIGVGNTVKGDQAWTSVAADAKEEDKKAAEESNKNTTQLNYVDGFYTKLTNGKNDYLIGAHNTVTGDSVEKNKSNIVFGDNHTLENQSNNIIIGSANTENTVTKASNAVIIGHNANASVDDGVAIGAESVANMGVPTTAGYDPSGATHKSTDAAWTATKAAVSVGNATKGSNGKFTGTTRQITNVAAGAEDTDAVNVAQLKQLKSVVDSASGKHTLVTVNGGKQAPKDTVPNNDKYSQYTPSSDGNLQLAQKVNDGQITYDLKLSDDLNIGKAGTNGKDGVDGKIGVNGKDGASVVINGKDGLPMVKMARR